MVAYRAGNGSRSLGLHICPLCTRLRLRMCSPANLKVIPLDIYAYYCIVLLIHMHTFMHPRMTDGTRKNGTLTANSKLTW